MKNVLLGLAAGVLIATGAFLLYFNWNAPEDLGESPIINLPGDNGAANSDETNNDELDNSEENITEEFDFDEAGIWVDQERIVADENALYVSGRANTFEASVVFKLYGEDGSLIQEDYTMANMPDIGKIGPFEKVIYFAAPPSHIVNGYLEVLDYSAMDGSEIYKVTVPVYFAYNDETELTVYFSHSAPAGSPDECIYVQPVKRYTIGTLAVARETILAMLNGPTNQEKNNGFFSGIPAGTRLNNIYIENRVAYVDFSEELNMTGGSCAVSGIRHMIERNLLQFDTVDSVVISVNGDSEIVLQP